MEAITVGMLFGFAMSLTNLFKKQMKPMYVPFLTLALAIVLQIGYTTIYVGGTREVLLEAAARMFALGVVNLGLFVAADEVRKSPKTTLDSERKLE